MKVPTHKNQFHLAEGCPLSTMRGSGTFVYTLIRGEWQDLEIRTQGGHLKKLLQLTQTFSIGRKISFYFLWLDFFDHTPHLVNANTVSNIEEKALGRSRVILVTCEPNQDTKARICTWSRVAEANTTRDVAWIKRIQCEYSVFSIHTFIVWGLKIYLVIGLYTMASVGARYECLMMTLTRYQSREKKTRG